MENTELDRLIKSSGIFLLPEKGKVFWGKFFFPNTHLFGFLGQWGGMCLTHNTINLFAVESSEMRCGPMGLPLKLQQNSPWPQCEWYWSLNSCEFAFPISDNEISCVGFIIIWPLHCQNSSTLYKTFCWSCFTSAAPINSEIKFISVRLLVFPGGIF